MGLEEITAGPRRSYGGALTIARRYWPKAHDVLRNTSGRWQVTAEPNEKDHAGEMHLNLEPHLVDVLRESLPAGAVVEAQ